MKPIRIACVRFLNTAPLVEGLAKMEGLSLLPAVPSRIADMVASGEADLGLCSIVDAVRSHVPLTLLPVGMIGCDGPTLTVRLFSRVPFEKVTSLHADTDSHTSVALARLILAKQFGVHPAMHDFDALHRAPGGDWPETVLLIGDKVVTDHPPQREYPHQLDLGEQWKAVTGLPFVYAIWMCRTEALSGPDAPRLCHAALLLDRQRRHNSTRLGWIVRTHAPKANWPVDLAETYLGELLRYDVGSREKEAVARFLAEASALSLVPDATPTWCDVDAMRPAVGAAS